MTASTAGKRLAYSSGGGASTRTPRSRRCRLARTSRCAMVACGNRNAAAIVSAGRPTTAFRVKAICEGSGRAGWQHANSRASLSSLDGSGGGVRARVDSFSRPVASRRCGDQPDGRAFWHAVVGPAVERLGDRVLQGLLGPVEVAEPAGEHAEHAGSVGAPHPVQYRSRITHAVPSLPQLTRGPLQAPVT